MTRLAKGVLARCGERAMVRILVVDDHKMLRQGMVAHFRRAGRALVYEAGTGTEAIQAFSDRHPDVVLLDVDLPDQSGFAVARHLRMLSPFCRLVFISGFESDPLIEQALAIETNGYLFKRASLDELTAAIDAVMRGQTYFGAGIRERLVRENGGWVLGAPSSERVALLTRRERELLRHLSLGASLKEAAAAMEVSYKTADNQKSSLMRKLNIHDRVELARFAIREGWVSLV